MKVSNAGVTPGYLTDCPLRYGIFKFIVSFFRNFRATNVCVAQKEADPEGYSG